MKETRLTSAQLSTHAASTTADQPPVKIFRSITLKIDVPWRHCLDHLISNTKNAKLVAQSHDSTSGTAGNMCSEVRVRPHTHHGQHVKLSWKHNLVGIREDFPP